MKIAILLTINIKEKRNKLKLNDVFSKRIIKARSLKGLKTRTPCV